LLRTLAEREPELRAHVADVSSLAVRVGERLGLSLEELEELRLAAELHDVGKLAIPDVVLQKSGSLDATEWGFIHSHTLIGQRIPQLGPRAAAGRRRSCARPTRTGTGPATRTGSPASRSRSRLGSSRPAMRTPR
jgi:hypothetical protein